MNAIFTTIDTLLASSGLSPTDYIQARSDNTVTLDAAAARMGVNRRTIEGWVASDTLPSVKIGGRRLIRCSDLTKLIQEGSS